MTHPRPAPLLLAAALLAVAASPAAWAQTVATGAGREDELAESARIDAYLSQAAASPSPAPSPASSSAVDPRLSPDETAASAAALARPGALPPMAADSPWARGLVGPTEGPLTLAGVDGAAPPCDHAVHGEAGAEIGTRGERGGYGVASMPVGRDCQVQVTVGVGTQRGPRWRGRDGEVTDASVRVDVPGFSLGVSGASGSGRAPPF